MVTLYSGNNAVWYQNNSKCFKIQGALSVMGNYCKFNCASWLANLMKSEIDIWRSGFALASLMCGLSNSLGIDCLASDSVGFLLSIDGYCSIRSY